MQQEETERAMSEAGVVRDESVKLSRKAASARSRSRKTRAITGATSRPDGAAAAQPTSIRRFALPAAPAQNIESQRSWPTVNGRAVGLMVKAMPEKQTEGGRRPRPVSADCDKQEGSGSDQADGHGEVALAALGEAVAAVDQDEEACGEEAGKPSFVRSHPSRWGRHEWGTRRVRVITKNERQAAASRVKSKRRQARSPMPKTCIAAISIR